MAPATSSPAKEPSAPPQARPREDESRHDRSPAPSLPIPLSASPQYSPDFFHLCRLLDTAYPEMPRVGTSVLPSEDIVRFSQEPSLSFPPVTIPRFKAGGEARAGRVHVNFMGLLGPHGPLPLHLTEFARDRERNAGDPTIARFFDIFNHRMISLFYRAWSVNQMTASADRPSSDRYVIYVGSLFGLGMSSLRRRDDLPDSAKLHYAGRLASGTRHAEGLEAVIRGYFGVTTRIIEFIGRWIELPGRYWCRLGERSDSARLGVGAIAGRSVWDVQSCFRIRLGPMGLADYCRLLPGGPAHGRLVAWVRNYVGMEFDFEVQQVLAQPQVPRMTLGGNRGTGSRLGWTTWLCTRPLDRDGDDLVTAGDRHVARVE
ncbi:MAG: type VI secretion system baseplate subunit TssG [Phycisphaeraceae bacterium]|nr:type VI secretion system baseplate subunit TssG [Phycisphaerae bacterium]MBX3393723.1 type VI secretion system baseplate subunit TssG [Phycisphaeraceae bacterium]